MTTTKDFWLKVDSGCYHMNRQQFCKDLVSQFETGILGNQINSDLFTIAWDGGQTAKERAENFEELARVALMCYRVGFNMPKL